MVDILSVHYDTDRTGWVYYFIMLKLYRTTTVYIDGHCYGR